MANMKKEISYHMKIFKSTYKGNIKESTVFIQLFILK